MNRYVVVGVSLCVGGMVILGGSVTLSRLILDYPALTGQALRYAVAWVILAALAGLAGRRSTLAARVGRRDLVILVALAAIGLVAFNLCILAALRHADAAIVGTVLGAAPLGLALTGPLLRRERPAMRVVVSAAIIVVGIALVHGAGHADAVGVAAALGALVGEVAFSLLAAEVLPRLGALRVSAWSCGLAVPMLALAALAVGEPAHWRLPTLPEALTLGYLAGALTVGAFLAWFTGLRLLGVERAGLFVGVAPAVTLATASIQDGVVPAVAQTVGVLVVVAGLAAGLVQRRSTVDHEGLRASVAAST